MEELGYGPNGGLIYCMECGLLLLLLLLLLGISETWSGRLTRGCCFRYLIQNLDWLQDLLAEYSDDDYFIFDCPGQIELYSHLPVMKQLCDALRDWGFAICGVYLVRIVEKERREQLDLTVHDSLADRLAIYRGPDQVHLGRALLALCHGAA